MSRESTLEVYEQGRASRLMPIHFCDGASVEVRMQSPPYRVIGVDQFWDIIVGKVVELEVTGDSTRLCVEDPDDGVLNDFTIARDGFFWYRHEDSRFECAYVLTHQGPADRWLESVCEIKV